MADDKDKLATPQEHQIPAIETFVNEQEIVDYIQINKKYAEENKRPDRAQIDKDYALYESKPDKRPADWMSNKFIPATFKTVEAILANIMGALYSTDPPFNIKPREAGDKTQARIMKNIISYQFNLINMYMRIYDFVKQCLIYGTSFGKIYWEKCYEPQTVIRPEHDYEMVKTFPFVKKKIKGYKANRENVLTKNNPVFDVIDIRDIFMSPTSIDIQDGWVIHRKHDTYGSLLQKAELGIYDKDRVLELKDVDIKYGDEDKPLVHDGKEDNEKTNKLTHRIQILEFWGKVPRTWIEANSNKEQFISAVITLAGMPDGYKVIRRQENPFWHGLNPFIKATYVRKPKEAYGKSVPQITGDLNLMINNIVNSRIENVMLAMQKIFIGLAGEVKSNQTVFPGVILTEDTPNALRPLDIPDMTPNAYQETFEIERYLQEASGDTKSSQGTGGGQSGNVNNTATGMSLVFRAASTRMMMQAKQMEYEAIKEILQRFYQLDYQYLDIKDVIRIVGEREGKEYTPSAPHDVFMDYDFIPAGTFTMENKDFLVQSMITYLKITQGTPYVNPRELIKKIGIEGFGFPADDPMFPTEEQIQGNIQKLQQLSQAGIPMGEGKPMAKPGQPSTAGGVVPVPNMGTPASTPK